MGCAFAKEIPVRITRYLENVIVHKKQEHYETQGLCMKYACMRYELILS